MCNFDNNFFDDRDLVECLNRGCEVEFMYNDKKYSITHVNDGISITEFNNLESEKTYSNARDALEYPIGEKRLKDIISDMLVIDRSF